MIYENLKVFVIFLNSMLKFKLKTTQKEKYS